MSVPGEKLPRLHNSGRIGPYWKKSGAGGLYLRGTGRYVVVVRSPDPRLFEEAIFVLKEDYVRARGAEQVLEEARRAAEAYLRRSGASPRPRRWLWGVAAGASALTAAAVWLALRLLV